MHTTRCEGLVENRHFVNLTAKIVTAHVEDSTAADVKFVCDCRGDRSSAVVRHGALQASHFHPVEVEYALIGIRSEADKAPSVICEAVGLENVPAAGIDPRLDVCGIVTKLQQVILAEIATAGGFVGAPLHPTADGKCRAIVKHANRSAHMPVGSC